jgi:hypothetical protein
MSLAILLLSLARAEDVPPPVVEPHLFEHCLGLRCDHPQRAVLGFGAELHGGLPDLASAELKLRVRVDGSVACITARWTGLVISAEPGLRGVRGTLGYESVVSLIGMWGYRGALSVYHPWGWRAEGPTAPLYVGPSMNINFILFTARGGVLVGVSEGAPNVLADLSVGVGW